MTESPDLASPTAAAKPVSLQDKGDLAVIISQDGHEQPALRGFDPKFRDIVDYIVKITHEIWEERGIGRLYDYYGTNIRLHTSSGDIYSRDEVIESTIQSLAAYPDRRLFAEDVIWSGDDDAGYFTSHRLVHTGHNWGHSQYGPPTGRKVRYSAIAECAVVEGVIVEEWLVRDRLSLLFQLGFDVQELARKQAAAAHTAAPAVTIPAEADRLRGQLPPSPADRATRDVDNFIRRAIHEVWNWRLLNKVDDYYIPAFFCDAASGRQLYGLNQYRNYILSLLSPFPDLSVTVDHICVLPDGPDRYRTATRWTMVGTHTGPGAYGAPTGNQIRIMGISHHLIQDGRFVREWTLFDEFALLIQLSRPAA